MNGNRIIAHAIIKTDKGYLVTKRSVNESTYKEYWDIPGGLVELGELPRDGLIRETKEEVGLDITPIKVIHEDSNLDIKKDTIFIRLVYLCRLESSISDIKLQLEEHSEYKFINSIKALNNDKIVSFLKDILNKNI